MGHHNRLMPPTSDADTDDSTDQPGTQRGAAASSDEVPSSSDAGEVEGGPGRHADEADQVTTDTGDSEDETEGERGDEPFPPRGALTLRALRWGGLLGALVLTATALALCRGLIGAGVLVPSEVSALPRYIIVGGLLVWPSLNFRKKKRPILVTIMTTVMATLGVTTSASLTLAWWDTYQETGFSVLFLLALAGVALSATLFLSASPLLHYLRTRTAAAGIGDPNDPSRWRLLHFKTGEKTNQGRPRYERIRVPHRTRAYLAALIIAPALTLGSAIAGTSVFINPVHHVTATTPADASLAPPTSLAPKASWSKEISSTEVTTVAGAGGPILLTDDGIMALNPKDGSVLWSYSRKQATFAPNSYSDSPRLITSPNGKYVTTRIQLPTFVASPHAITLVFDALTGRLVFERQGTGGYLQLTDSAVLDDDTAFSLTDGSQMWTLPESSSVSYSGPAGHASFILGYFEDGTAEITPSGTKKAAMTITVCPQNNPTAEVEVQQILSEFTFDEEFSNTFTSFINGWVARYTGELDSSGNPMAEAISLDALAKVDGSDATSFPLGTTSGINTVASRLSDSIVTYPVIAADAVSKYPQANARAATVFDPSTNTVTPASQDRSLASARTGIVEIPADDGSTSAALVIQPGNGSPGTTIPVTPGSTFRSPQELADDNGIPLQPLFSPNTASERRARAVRTPGTTVVTLNTTEIGYAHCSNGPRTDGQRCRDIYRIFGVAGAEE